MPDSFAKVCRVCGTALHGPLGHLFHLFGIRRSGRNPNVCNRCDAHLLEGKTVEVTVLFADLTAFTKLTNELGAERSYEIVTAYFAMAKEVLFRHDAYIDKYIGDAVMAFFNVPIRNPRHAQSALKAAMAIQQGMQAVSAAQGITLQTRVGVASGHARMGRLGAVDGQDFTVIGEAVNLAARLESLAHPGEILIDATTALHCAHHCMGLEPELLDVKGFGQPVTAYRLDASKRTLLQSSMGEETGGIRQRLGLASVLFTILGAPCALSAALSPLSIALGVVAATGATSTFSHVLDAAPIRIPLQLFGVTGALVNLYVIRHAAMRRKLAGMLTMPASERRKVMLVTALSWFSLLAVAMETYHHIVVKGLSWFGPPL